MGAAPRWTGKTAQAAQPASFGGGAKGHGGEVVGYAPAEDALFDYHGVLSHGPLVVEEVAAGFGDHRRAVVHCDQGARHVLAHVFFGEGALFHEHVHLNAVTERLVDYHSRDLWGADALVLAGGEGLRVQELQGDAGNVLHAGVHAVHELRAAEGRKSLAAHFDLLALRRHRQDCAGGPEDVLLQLPVGGEIELAVFLPDKVRLAVKDLFGDGKATVPQGGEAGDYLAVAHLVGVDLVVRAAVEGELFGFGGGVDALPDAVGQDRL